MSERRAEVKPRYEKLRERERGPKRNRGERRRAQGSMPSLSPHFGGFLLHSIRLPGKNECK